MKLIEFIKQPYVTKVLVLLFECFRQLIEKGELTKENKAQLHSAVDEL